MLLVALVCAPACGSAGSSPAFRRVGELPKAPLDELVTGTSDCATAPLCRTACDAGETTACTRLGDLLWTTSPDRAEEQWLGACKDGHGLACARLMHVTATDTEVSERYGTYACGYGEARACDYLGEARFLRAREEQLHADAGPLYRDSVQFFARGCRADNWLSCARAAQAAQLGGLRVDDDINRWSRKGLELARAACDDRDNSACGFLADIAEQQGDQASATSYYAKGCRALLEGAPPEQRKALIERPMCQAATKLGVAPPDLRAVDPATTLATPAPVSADVLEQQRIAGESRVLPSHSIRRYMHRQGLHELRVDVALCLSELGWPSSIELLHSSGSATYDQAIFRAMRTWRYRPYMVRGQPAPVCTLVRFVYHQRD